VSTRTCSMASARNPSEVVGRACAYSRLARVRGLRGADVRRAALEFERRARGLEEGDVASANETLGRPFVLRGRVEPPGDARRGRARLRDRQPRTRRSKWCARRIYAGAAEDARSHVAPRRRSLLARAPSSTRTALSSSRSTCRRFEGDLYDASLDVAFLARLRGEEVFSDVDRAGAQNRTRTSSKPWSYSRSSRSSPRHC